MISLNLTNFITIGIIAVAAFAAVKMGTRALGINVSWL